MSFEGKFYWIECMRQGGRKAISFTLTCTNLFQSETFDAAIVDGTGQLQPMIFRQLNLPAKKSLRFDFDTVGWNWCQGDTFAILDAQGQMAHKWTLNLKVPAPGECKDCHGTHKCRHCNGRGTITNHRTHEIYSCETCKGTGICQTCFVPMRNPQFYNQDYSGQGNSEQQMPNPDANRQRRINSLRQRIYELQAKIEKAKWDERIMRLRDTDISSYCVYQSQLNLKFQYEKQLLRLRAELQQLEESY